MSGDGLRDREALVERMAQAMCRNHVFAPPCNTCRFAARAVLPVVEAAVTTATETLRQENEALRCEHPDQSGDPDDSHKWTCNACGRIQWTYPHPSLVAERDAHCATIAKMLPERLVSLAWVREQLNDETLREAVADATKGWHPLRASDAPVVSAALAAVRAKFGASDE